MKKRSQDIVREMDALECPLDGVHLIEASAGTGKTHTLSNLFLRLLLERHLLPSAILVVTFTRAAVDELKDRIRKRFREAHEAFRCGRHDDAFLDALIDRHTHRDKALRDLEAAIRDFDEAAIFTIHGFCRRALQEHAFETGALFDTELLSDDRAIYQDLLEDFWRKRLYPAPPEFVRYALSRGLSPKVLMKGVNRGLLRRPVRVLPAEGPPAITNLPRLRGIFEELKARWTVARSDVTRCLMNPGLRGQPYGTLDPVQGGPSRREGVIADLLGRMDAFTALPFPLLPLFKGFDKLTSRYIREAVKKGNSPPTHPLFDLCQDLADESSILLQSFDRWVVHLRAEMMAYLRDGLDARKHGADTRTFDDLIAEMGVALRGEGGEALGALLKKRYRAALIDEFQDTDSDQYAIFRQVFGRGPDASLFLIGDPKQAIYGFRGADLFTYLQAARAVPNRYTLSRNWRSDPELLDAFNALFTLKTRPFLLEEIRYTPAAPAQGGDLTQLRIRGEGGFPLRVWVMEQQEGSAGGALNKAAARESVIRAVAGEVRRLVALGSGGKAFIGPDPLRERDMAILVRKNREARAFQQALGALGIRSVLFSTGNLFDALEALELERVLSAVLLPNQETPLLAALATDILGYDGLALERLRNSEAAWEAVAERFLGYHVLWREKGVLPMLRYLMAKENVRPRLLAYPDGERRLTNLLHLSEVLHQAALEGRLGMRGLLKWLSDQRRPDSLRLDEHQLRLESDEDAVKIVTIHKSKGLEYPVVFCPFHWDTLEPGGEALFHDPESEHLTLDLGSSDLETHKKLAAEERLAEDLRLLYVAVTRAKYRAYLVWGPVRGAEDSALGYLLRDAPRAPVKLPMKKTPVGADLDPLVEKAPGAIRIAPLPGGEAGPLPRIPEAPEGLVCRSLSAAPPEDWRIASFSSLVAAGEALPDLPEHDGRILPGPETGSLPDRPEEEAPPEGIHAFPRGARAGTFFHDILAGHDFTDPEPGRLKTLVTEKLMQYGFDLSWVETVTETALKVIRTPLDPAIPGLELSTVRRQDRVDEMEFYYPLKAVSCEDLGRLYRSLEGPWSPTGLPEAIGRLRFSPARGFMKGFMDLVFQKGGRFYLVDWKSNALGTRTSDYSPQSLVRAMVENFYILQYHIYTLALDLYLGNRVPRYRYETHFGGVYYLFLRGMEPEAGPGFGIFRDLPDPRLISAMKEALVGA